MQYNTEANNQDCVSEILSICNATLATYDIKKITRRFNAALDWYFYLAFMADARWAFDDLNQTSPPLESITMTSGTNKYALDTFVSEIINVLRVEALDPSGNAYLLKPFDAEQVGSQALSYFSSGAGTPSRYRKYGKWLYLDTTPNYTIANGISLYFNRPASRMVVGDTTKVPGVPSIHHNYLCRKAAAPFLIEKKLPQLQSVLKQIGSAQEGDPYYGGDELAIVDHFSHRDTDTKPIIHPRHYNPR